MINFCLADYSNLIFQMKNQSQPAHLDQNQILLLFSKFFGRKVVFQIKPSAIYVKLKDVVRSNSVTSVSVHQV